MSEKTLTPEAVKNEFCAADKKEVLTKIRERLDDVWDIGKAADLLCTIGKEMDAHIKEEGLTWTPGDRILWAVKEAFILGSLDMAAKLMIVNDMGYEALAGQED